MSKRRKILIGFLALIVIIAGVVFWITRGDTAELAVDEVAGTDPTLTQPRSETIPTVNIAEPVGWADGEAPLAADGLEVTRFAEGLDHPRIVYTMPNGDVLVTLTNRPASEGDGGIVDMIMGWLFAKAGAGDPSPNKLVLLRDADGDGRAEVNRVLRDDLDSPSGIAWRDGTLYIAEHDALVSFAYEEGADTLEGEPTKLMDLAPGGNHWMRNIAIDPSGEAIYVAVGSASNIAEKGLALEEGRAMIWEYDLASKRQSPFATGLRNPNGLAFNPQTDELWTTVNERDMLGSDLVPDYLTNVPIGAQYGWPWVYWGDNVDMRVDPGESPMPRYLVEYTRKPEYALGPHVAALGLAFAREGNRMGAQYGSGAFIARHGSWNRKPASGYDVVFVPFDNRGNPVEGSTPVPILTGFLTGAGTTRGRPTWVSFANDGALLVSDDTAGIIWRVIAPGAEAAPRMERESYQSLPPRRELRGDPTAAFEEDYAREVNATD
ncbi:PQQ-dependent sugar dehydrogenase [Altererythrobacter sp. CAU 1778]